MTGAARVGWKGGITRRLREGKVSMGSGFARSVFVYYLESVVGSERPQGSEKPVELELKVWIIRRAICRCSRDMMLNCKRLHPATNRRNRLFHSTSAYICLSSFVDSTMFLAKWEYHHFSAAIRLVGFAVRVAVLDLKISSSARSYFSSFAQGGQHAVRDSQTIRGSAGTSSSSLLGYFVTIG